MKGNQNNFISYAQNFAAENSVHIYLSGSFSIGKATVYSDIDLAAAISDIDLLENFIYGYETPVFISCTLNPPGIIIVIYPDGVALDLEIITGSHLSETFFHREKYSLADYTPDRTAYQQIVTGNSRPFSISRLFHRSIIKYLSGKKALAFSILEEIAEFTEYKAKDKSNYKTYFTELLEYFHSVYPLKEPYKNLLEFLKCEL